ncbi:MAG: M20/M25/M40 family metallo-hydrolase [Planctomycetota bacterium]|nr:MAG: M20/M25/M40 family metallo-hydrolase [Planctomycetota bacterium]
MLIRLLPFVIASTVLTPAALAQPTYVERLNETPDPDRLRAWHDLLASEPHIAGTEGDARVIRTLAESFQTMGFEVDVHEFWPYLSYPISAEVEVLHPEIELGAGMLPLQEVPLRQDEFSQDEGLTIGFNAYSGSGEAIGEVVYANFGRKQDFEQLAEMGIDCTGTIVLARYGGNYRGYKVKFAEEAGAAGLLIYLDPGDSGFVKGGDLPRGRLADRRLHPAGLDRHAALQGRPAHAVHRGDRGRRATRSGRGGAAADPRAADRLGSCAADHRADGGARGSGGVAGRAADELPAGRGDDLRVRVNVQQERKIAKTANVIAKMEGSTYPDQWVIVGCHHDAWGFGACDAMSGMISLMESARSVAELAESGWRPERTVIFAAWGAEEFGIIGSTEWVEANADELREKAVAYINLDMASMGPNFGASASPSLRRLIEDAARDVPQARAGEVGLRGLGRPGGTWRRPDAAADR